MTDAPDAYRAPSKRTLPLLENLRIAAPCEVSWDQMKGNGRVRHCPQCDKQVFNVSAMSRADAEVLIHDRVEGVCVRLYKRHDGTILTSDCPVGTRRGVRGRALMSLGAAAALLGGLANMVVGLRESFAPVVTLLAPMGRYARHTRRELLSVAGAGGRTEVLVRAGAPVIFPPSLPSAGQHTMGAVCAPRPAPRAKINARVF